MRNVFVVTCLAMCSSITAPAAQPVAKVQLPCESRFLALSPTGTQAAVHCKDRSLNLVSIPGGAQREVVPAERHLSAYVFSPDGQWLATGFPDGTVELMATQGDTPAKQWRAGPDRIDGLYFFPDGKRLLVAPVDNSGQVWDLSGTPTLRASLPVDFGGLAAYAVSPDGKQLVAAGGDTVVRWYDTSSWQKTQEYTGFLLETFALAFTPDGKQVLAGGADSRITALDAATAKQLRQLPTDPGSYIVDIQMLGDGQRAATLYLDDAGEKPLHGAIWNVVTAHSAILKFDSPPSCAGVVGGKYWSCTIEGKTLTIRQLE